MRAATAAVVLAALVGHAAAFEPITDISIGTIITILSTVMSVLSFIITAIRFGITYTIFFAISILFFAQFVGIVKIINVIALIHEIVKSSALDCTPYGPQASHSDTLPRQQQQQQ